MIFNEMNTNTAVVSYEAVQESPYELGIGGALMHVYENECNYNALMKAAALSEMKYYNENGGDLFVHEAGAFKGFLQKAKEFFLKVIEKIKSIGKKFMAVINQYRLKDSDFIKKYETDLKRREKELKDFEFKGYKFNLELKKLSTSTATRDITANTDDINEIIERNRGNILGKDSMTESDFRKELKDAFYGDKEDFKVNIEEWLKYIKDTKSDVEKANKLQKTLTDEINTFITNLDKLIKSNNDKIDSSLEKGGKITDEDNSRMDDSNKLYKNRIDMWKALSNDFTIYYGAFTKALADRNRQAKAICVKALSYKHESATVVEGGYNNIFAGVEII